MDNEYENELTSNQPGTPVQPESSGSVFNQTVFGSMQNNNPVQEPAVTQQVYTAPVQPESQPAQPVYTEPVQAEPVQPEPVQAEPVQQEPAQPTYTPPQQSVQGTYNYTQQSIPPYGQNRNPYSQTGTTGSYYGQHPQYGEPAYGGVPPYTQPQQPEKKHKGLKTFFGILVAVVIVGLVFAVVALARGNKKQETVINEKGETVTAAVNAPEMETKASPSSNTKGKDGEVLTPAQIAAKVRESSVGILVYASNKSGLASEGTGVLWKEDDTNTYTYIITCAHVINGSGYTYTVQTEDGKTFDAEMVGADAKTDLGVLRIKKTGLKLAEFGDSGALQVGDPVYAIGNPGGTEFFGSFTNGIVSAIDRSVKSDYNMVCIQHTAAINPGNSGGALVNQYGQVIGINSQKIVQTGYEGIGFAIPIKSAQSIINSLASYGYVANRPKLGITYTEAVNYQQYSMIIKIKGMPAGSLIITEINEDSSLAKTDARQYDMIIAVNGEKLTTPNVLLDKIEKGKVGDKLKLTLCRIDNNYQTTEFDVTVTLVEEKKSSPKETTTQQSAINPYDFFNDDFFNSLF